MPDSKPQNDSQSSTESGPKPARPWRQVAEEATREFDPKKMTQLMSELNQALEEQGIVKPDGDNPKKKSA